MSETPPLPTSQEAAPSSVSQQLLSSSAVMAVGTLFSRLTGFVRAGMLAAAIGVSAHADVFMIANTIPNSLYILVAGGVFNTVLVPQLVRAIKSDADGGDAYANRIVTLGALVLGGVSAVLILLAPWLLRLLVDGSYFTDPGLDAHQESLLDFARWCLPQIFLYGMFVLVGQILNARGRFGPMMWAPIANNVISVAVIGCYLAVYAGEPAVGGYTTSQELLLGLGSTIGIAAQLAILIPYLRASGFVIRPRFDFRGTGLSHTLRLGLWTVGMVIVNQLAFYVMVRRASAGSAESGGSGYTVYANAFLLTQVPHSIITVSLATAAMPLMSRYAADHRLGDVSGELVRTLRLALSVIVPFAAALLVLGPALATVLFSWGEAEGETTALGYTLIAFAPGMVVFTLHYLALRGFYSLEDTKTPFFIQCAIAATNITLAVVLTIVVPPEYVAPSLAVAYGASYLVGSLVSLHVLAHRLVGLARRQLLAYVARVAAAALPAAGVAWLCVVTLGRLGLEGDDKSQALVVLAVGGIVGALGYLALARLLHIAEIASLVRLVAARGRSV
ncbi:MAG: murein biosynthesis integral membrane protein MurJ [Nocardioidaceae bacterium]